MDEERKITDEERELNYQEYMQNLQRILDSIQANHKTLFERKRQTIQHPDTMLMGLRKTTWKNFKTIATAINRSEDHLLNYFQAELATDNISIDSQGCMQIKGRFTSKQIENILNKYSVEYCKCHMCSSTVTELQKNPSTRLTFLLCQTCGAQRAVSCIESGFKSKEKGQRAKERIQNK